MPNATVKHIRYANAYNAEDELNYDDPEVRARLDKNLQAAPPKPDVIDPDTGNPDPENINAEETTYKKRYGDLRRYQQEQASEFKKKEQSYKTQLAEATNKNIELPKSEAEVKEWAEKYPDVYAIVETIAKRSTLADRELTDARLEEIETMRQQVNRDRAENKIRKSHTDFDDLKVDEKFHEWVASKPKWVQDALYINDDDADAVIGVLDFYKSEKAAKEPKVVARKPTEDARQAAAMVTRARPSTDISEHPESRNLIKESDVKKLNGRQYERFEPEIDKAISEGRFVYDLTGGAR